MIFVAPMLALAGLAAMAVPIILHFLFRRRRRPVEWAAMRQLMEAVRRTSRRLRMEQLLLLAVRCALLVVLGCALAQPLLRAAGIIGGGAARTVFVVIDNSITSATRELDGRSALERSVDEAVSVIEQLSPTDSVGVFTTARPAHGVVVPPSTDHASVVRLLRTFEPVDTPSDLPAALAELNLAINRVEPGGRVAAYLLSSFRAGSALVDTPLPALAGSILPDDVHLLASPPATDPVRNVQVVSIDPLRSLILPGQADGSGQVTVRLARGGDRLDRATSTVRLEGDAIRPLAARRVEWSEGQSTGSVTFLVETDAVDQGTTGLTAFVDVDGQPRDDVRHGVLEARRAVRVALLDRRTFGLDTGVDRLSSSQWMSRALRPFDESPIEVTTFDPTTIDDRDLRTVDAVLLPRPDVVEAGGWQALGDFVDRGGLLLVTPPAELNVHLWADTMTTALDLPWSMGIEPFAVESGEPLAETQPSSELLHLLAGELPALTRPVEVYRRLPIDAAATRAATLLTVADGSPLVIAGTPQRREGEASNGLVVLMAAAPDLNWTNLPAKPFMVPLMQELVRQGVGVSVAGRRAQVGDQPVLPSSVTELVRRARAGDREAPELVLGVDPTHRPVEPIRRAGLYRLLDGAGLDAGVLAANVDPPAARTEPQSPEVVAAWLSTAGAWRWFDTADPAAPLRTVEGSTSIAGTLLLLALTLAIAETVLARRFSHASLAGRAVAPVPFIGTEEGVAA